MANLFLKPQYLRELQEIFHEYCPKATVWAYGSRLDGDAHSGSDLDLAISYTNNQDVDIVTLRSALKESNIPFLLDIFDFERLPESFKTEIKHKRLEIFPYFDVTACTYA